METNPYSPNAGGCTQCPLTLANPEAIPPELLARFQHIQLDCERHRQAMAAYGARFTHDVSLHVADLTLDRIDRRVQRAGREIDLTEHEFDLLAYLMSHAGEVCRRKDILASVWHYRPDTQTNTLTEYIKYLRTKIDDGFETRLIHTVHGKGYRIGPV